MAAKPTNPTKQIIMNWRDAAAALVRANNLHEGHWRIYLHFAPTTGLNADMNGTVLPAALVPVLRIGLMREEKPSALSVDAAQINPSSNLVVPAWAGGVARN